MIQFYSIYAYFVPINTSLIKRHDEIWPEMTQALVESGIKNYNIFKHGLDLFGYFETDDLSATQAYLAKNEVNKRWAEYMAPIMKVDIDPSTEFPKITSL